jgi:enamine deaminase RidA (YjgF/YER057c/UK114 family)
MSDQSSGVTFNAELAYPKAVRVGQFVWVGGTTAAAAGGAVGGDDIVEQTREVLRRIETALKDVDARPEDVVRTRMFVTDISRWAGVVAAHGEVFPHRPAATMVEVSKLIAPWLLVEIEADAVIRE